ncbi:MAG: GNAT family N-acetyltransferase [Spirochaetaceae bacterium]|jgi:GNAT superfamily N-acetyltransferase|nr:GNAT family N-acetyltransferase [Spirochaetaceae bacterium]
MQFELSKALEDDILFSMEDQNQDFLVDTHNGVIINREEIDENYVDQENRFISLPIWDSSDGYRLMERFAASFKNPIVRERLTDALNRGKGVFRAFKNVLGLYPESERLWFTFKERAMKKTILKWYNALREEWGLDRIGVEPEETDDLVLEDFKFRGAGPEDLRPATDLHRRCLEDYRDYAEKNGLTGTLEVSFAGPGPRTFPGDLSLVAETGSGDFAAYVSSIRQGSVLYITALEVNPEYRGLGLGETLLSRLVTMVDSNAISTVLVDIPGDSEGFARVLLRENFKPYVYRYSLTLPKKPVLSKEKIYGTVT